MPVIQKLQLIKCLLVYTVTAIHNKWEKALLVSWALKKQDQLYYVLVAYKISLSDFGEKVREVEVAIVKGKQGV